MQDLASEDEVPEYDAEGDQNPMQSCRRRCDVGQAAGKGDQFSNSTKMIRSNIA